MRNDSLASLRPDCARLEWGREVIEVEASALALLAKSLDHGFSRAVDIILEGKQRTVVSGIGKSGHVAHKIAATFASTGTPALFLHPAEAAHGDLGKIMPGDVLLIFSNSGSTPELQAIIRHATDLGCPIIGVASQKDSPLMRASLVQILLPVLREACPINVAPTTSTALMLALGDALAVAVMKARGFSRERFKLLHPGGSIGNRLVAVQDIMHAADKLPLVSSDMAMSDTLVIMTEKSFGIAGVVDADGFLLGVVTDGDLRRNVGRLFSCTAGEVMTQAPKTVVEGDLVEDALSVMQAHCVTALFVMAHDEPRRPVGLVHVHDITRLDRT